MVLALGNTGIFARYHAICVEIYTGVFVSAIYIAFIRICVERSTHVASSDLRRSRWSKCGGAFSPNDNVSGDAYESSGAWHGWGDVEEF